MQPQLISHSPDLTRLLNEGYEFEIINGQHLVVHHIPYVNPARQVKFGSIVCVLTLASPSRTARPPDHTAYFIGETPCEADGVPLMSIIHNSQVQALTTGLLVNHYFSSKPACGYYDSYYDKIRTYAEILCAQAQAIDNTVTTRPKRQKIPSS